MYRFFEKGWLGRWGRRVVLYATQQLKRMEICCETDDRLRACWLRLEDRPTQVMLSWCLYRQERVVGETFFRQLEEASY